MRQGLGYNMDAISKLDVHKNKAIIVHDNSNDSAFELARLKGGFWRTMGFSIGSRLFLHAEEALYLLERNQLIAVENGNIVDIPYFYDMVLQKRLILPCYMAYLKLKVISFIILIVQSPIAVFTGSVYCLRIVNEAVTRLHRS